MKKTIIIINMVLLSSLTNAQTVIPGKLRYYNNQSVAEITKTPGTVAKDVTLYKYSNATVAGGKDIKLHKYDNATVAAAVSGKKDIKLHKYNNETIAKSVGSSNVKLKNYSTNFNVPVVGQKTQNIQNQQPRLNSNNLNFDGKNQKNTTTKK